MSESFEGENVGQVLQPVEAQGTESSDGRGSAYEEMMKKQREVYEHDVRKRASYMTTKKPGLLAKIFGGTIISGTRPMTPEEIMHGDALEEDAEREREKEEAEANKEAREKNERIEAEIQDEFKSYVSNPEAYQERLREIERLANQKEWFEARYNVPESEQTDFIGWTCYNFNMLLRLIREHQGKEGKK